MGLKRILRDKREILGLKDFEYFIEDIKLNVFRLFCIKIISLKGKVVGRSYSRNWKNIVLFLSLQVVAVGKGH